MIKILDSNKKNFLTICVPILFEFIGLIIYNLMKDYEKNDYSEVSCSNLQAQTPKTNLEIDLLVRL